MRKEKLPSWFLAVRTCQQMIMDTEFSFPLIHDKEWRGKKNSDREKNQTFVHEL